MTRSLFRKFIDLNLAVCRGFDRLLPDSVCWDGNKEFQRLALPSVLGSPGLLYDLGGGSRPCVTLEQKRNLSLSIVGLDISQEELLSAPADVYDKVIPHDLCTYVGNCDGDIVVCQATLEHVPDTPGAMRAISSCLKDGGRAAIFAPGRNAIFARLNLILPEGLKRALLFSIFPAKAQGHDGFPAHYDHCTPSDIDRLAAKYNLIIEEKRLFWNSSYFRFFFPLYLVWRLSQLGMRLALGQNAAEAFYYILRKDNAVADSKRSASVDAPCA